jgi:hypothetical protein
MSDESTLPPPPRKVCLEDFLEKDDKNSKNKQNKSYSQFDASVAKNQQQFGHRKRIKP